MRREGYNAFYSRSPYSIYTYISSSVRNQIVFIVQSDVNAPGMRWLNFFTIFVNWRHVWSTSAIEKKNAWYHIAFVHAYTDRNISLAISNRLRKIGYRLLCMCPQTDLRLLLISQGHFFYNVTPTRAHLESWGASDLYIADTTIFTGSIQCEPTIVSGRPTATFT